MKNCCICEKPIADPDTAVLTGTEDEKKAVCADCAKMIARCSDSTGKQSKVVNNGAIGNMGNNKTGNNAMGNLWQNINWSSVLRVMAVVSFFLTVFLGIAYAIQVGGAAGFGAFVGACAAAVFLVSIIMVFAKIADDVSEIKKNTKNKD